MVFSIVGHPSGIETNALLKKWLSDIYIYIYILSLLVPFLFDRFHSGLFLFFGIPPSPQSVNHRISISLGWGIRTDTGCTVEAG